MTTKSTYTIAAAATAYIKADKDRQAAEVFSRKFYYDQQPWRYDLSRLTLNECERVRAAYRSLAAKCGAAKRALRRVVEAATDARC